MKLDNWIIGKSANTIVLALISPIMLGFLLLFIVGTKDYSSVFVVLAIVIFLELGFCFIYTNSLASIVIQHTKETGLSMQPIKAAGLFSVTILTGFCLSIVYMPDYVTSVLLIFMISEYIRFHHIAKVLITVEKQPLNFWNYVTHIWLLANPIVGIWPLHQRVKNLVSNQKGDDAPSPESS
tara:strand:+ start:746 stop:1288 length:543 start_codon:yes stop_codon:yes gene_type:complete